MHDQYESPLATRYASREMSALFSLRRRIVLFRKLWISLASAQKKLGLNITERQIDQMRKCHEDIPFEKAAEYEKRFRHDVVAHIHTFGDQCPDAKPIIHLGATSTYVTDNADLIQLKEALRLIIAKLSIAIRRLATFAEKYADTPTIGLTHYQSAQPTTVGKRACLWLQDLLTDAIEFERIEKELPFLGAKGATGTQASFLALFNGDEEKVKQLEKLIAADFGFNTILPISGQTYPRKIDLLSLNALAAFASGVHKMATDLRLLAHDQEMFEPHLEAQVGSSAMPYKRNPIYAERICGISRFLISLSQNPAYTLAVQWFERTLDDSANRRLSIPEAFLSADAILNILIPLIDDLHVEGPNIQRHLEDALPQLMIENILMEAVKRGGNRQELHEKLRRLNQAKKLTAKNIAADSAFGLTEEEVSKFSDIAALIGRAPAQVREFIKGPVEAFLKRHAHLSIALPPLEV
ncbi:MAG: adenylosuccinate lyase [Parachlamydiales bacterium]|nr:adenylosuccinate lyase [Parachlamydiales bacterium]